MSMQDVYVQIPNHLVKKKDCSKPWPKIHNEYFSFILKSNVSSGKEFQTTTKELEIGIILD